jgi:hypothetical protein
MRMHVSARFWKVFDSDTAHLLSGGKRLPLSVVGGPIDDTGDEGKMGTGGLPSECYFPIFEHFHDIE